METWQTSEFDGVICIGGEDWWYHNRGHFDFQIMRRIARKMPVLFVNSLGVRMPTPGTSLDDGRKFIGKIGRKLKSLSNGVTNVENKFWVFSPVMAPGATGQKLTAWALAPQIKLAALRAGIQRPLLWIHCPAGAALVGALGAVATVLQRTDRFEAFTEADGTTVGDQIRLLKTAADLVVYAAPHLMQEETGTVARQLLVTHGVELDRFVADGRSPGRGPADLVTLARPRVGFIGGIDAHTFDPELFLDVARRLPDLQFVLVGGSSLPEGWCTLSNVRMTGRVPYEVVSRYMAAMDVLIMPWNKSEWIKACNPVKLKEYLAIGRPVVTTEFRALDGWRDVVRVAEDAASFAAAIRASLAEGFNVGRVLPRLEKETWDAKADLVLNTLKAVARARQTAPMEIGEPVLA
jgi:glycosyltransferase involved in cell wall biosynthesis